MTIAIDASSPPVANHVDSSSTITSASFTPPVGSWLITVAVAGWGGTPTIVMSDSQSGSWSNVILANTNVATNGAVSIQKRKITSSVAMTVTATWTNLGGGKMLGVYVVTGADATTPIGATTGGEITSGTNFTKSLTTTTTGSLVLGGANETFSDTFTLASNTAWAPMSGTNPVTNSTDAVSYAVFKGSSLTGTPGALSYGVTSSASDNGHVALVEIVGSGSATVNGTDGTTSIVDTATVQASVPAAETGGLADTATVTAPVAATTETASGLDVATVKVSGAADTALSDEATAVLSGGSTIKFASDTGASSEATAPMVIKDTDAFTAQETLMTATLGIQGTLPPGPRIVRVGASMNTSTG